MRAGGGGEPNPVMAAVHRMKKKKKRVKLSFTENGRRSQNVLGQMELAVEEDEMSIAERRPAVKKFSHAQASLANVGAS
jgi:hypothetical protein